MNNKPKILSRKNISVKNLLTASNPEPLFNDSYISYPSNSGIPSFVGNRIIYDLYYRLLNEKPHLVYNITLKEFHTICRFPFIHTMKLLKKDELYVASFNYFGKFMVNPKKILWQITVSKRQYEKKLIFKKTYDAKIKVYKLYVKHFPKLFYKFKYKMTPDYQDLIDEGLKMGF